jgi:hypothetical protein
MKYTININQFALFNAGLFGKIDYSDIAILEYLKDFVYYKNHKSVYVKESLNKESVRTTEGQGNEYIWLNYNHLIASLPFAYFKSKASVSRRVLKLKSLGLINTYQAKDNTLYYTFTDKMIDLLFYIKTPFKPIKNSHRDTETISHSRDRVGLPFIKSKSDSDENGNPEKYNIS